jgi:hypothetical protein
MTGRNTPLRTSTCRRPSFCIGKVLHSNRLFVASPSQRAPLRLYSPCAEYVESPPRQFLRDLLDGVIDDDLINQALVALKNAEYNADWDDEDNSDLTRFHV